MDRINLFLHVSLTFDLEYRSNQKLNELEALCAHSSIGAGDFDRRYKIKRVDVILHDADMSYGH